MPAAKARPGAKKAPAKKAAATGKAARKKAATKKKAATRKAAARRPTRRQRAEAKRRDRVKRMRARAGSRYLVHYDVDGPRVRLGLLWFAGAVVAFLLGLVAIALYFGVTFSAAGAHALRTWRARGAPVDPRVALLFVAAIVLGAAVHPRLMGGALVLATAVVVGLALRDLEGEGGFRAAAGHASLALQTAVPTAVAAGCLVLLADLEPWAAFALVLLVSAYETGDFLIGSGSVSAWEGPLAGGVAVVVVAFAVAALGFPPFELGEAVAFGVLVAPLAFGGQLLASVLLPHARAFAPALRRVDSLLLAAPVWYLGIDTLVV